MIYKIKTYTVKLKIKEVKEKTVIKSSDKAYQILREIYKGLDDNQEHVVLLTLNNANQITSYKVLFSCGVSGGAIDLTILFRNILLLGSNNFILAHNHPGGRLDPSEEDMSTHRAIQQASAMLKITYLDHLIVTDAGYYSTTANQSVICKPISKGYETDSSPETR